jgi:phosphoglucomutase
MIGDQIRDKDGVSAVALICEMAAYEKRKGRSLFDKLIDLYVQHGFYKESLVSITKKGMDGASQIAAMMAGFRKDPPERIAGSRVVQLLDYESGKGKDLLSGKTWDIDVTRSNVLQFLLEDGSKISARPSGTEPKIKFYFSVNAPLASRADFDAAVKKLDERLSELEKAMGL